MIFSVKGVNSSSFEDLVIDINTEIRILESRGCEILSVDHSSVSYESSSLRMGGRTDSKISIYYSALIQYRSDESNGQKVLPENPQWGEKKGDSDKWYDTF